MSEVSIKEAVVFGITFVLVSVAFIPVVNAQFVTIFKNSPEEKIGNDKTVNPANFPPLGNCNLFIKLPTNLVTMVVQHTSTNSYFNTTLSNVSSGYDVSNGSYLGWCIDLDHYIRDNILYQVSLYSSYNTSMPSHLWHNNLSKVNYILNNKQGFWRQVQYAIWYILDFGDVGLNDDGWAMVNDAIANGSNFCPGIGDVIAIIADAGTNVQYTVLEVQVPVYTLTVYTNGNGSVIPSGGTFASGTIVNITATADPDWFFSHWSDDLSGSNNPETINMTSNKTVTAHFIQSHVNYTLNVSIAGSGSVDLDPPGGTYPSNTIVNITATADPGWSFSHWSGDLGGSNNPETITMTSNKSVNAHFTQDQYTLTVTIVGNGTVIKNPNQTTYTYGTLVELTANADPEWTFSYWSGDLTGSKNPETITMTSNKVVTATFTQDQYTYTLTINIIGNGIVTKNPDQATYTYGTPVELTANADPEWTFSYWSGDLSGSSNPETITMDSNKSVTAHFIQDQYTLTVTIAGNGTVIKNPNQTTYTYGTLVELTATADPGWTFDSWSGDLTGSANPATINMTGDKTVTATLTEDQYTLTINIVGNGSVSKNPNQPTYTYGTLVELTANADPEWTFSYWSGDLTGSKNPETITMTSNKVVTATFTQDQYTYTLTINIIGNGIVTKNPDQNTYSSGTVVTLTANADPGWTFSHWSDDLSGSNNPESINMTGDKNVTAHFEGSSGSSGLGNQDPSADANGPYSGFVDEEITFDGSGSTDDGTITNYTWDFGDNTTGYGVNPVHVYDTPGEYTVILTVTDDYGATDNGETTADIIMPNRPPSDPEIDGPQNGTKNIGYIYTAVSTDPDNDTISYIFNWDDGETNTTEFFANGTAATQTHNWTSAGKYTITVEAYDNETYSGTTSHVVLIDMHIVDDIGYITDDDADGTYDTFHDTDVETDLGQQDGKYLIDNDGDDEWDYVYDMDTGELTEYEGEPTQPEEDYTYIIILIIILVALIIAFGALIKTRQPPKKSERPPKKPSNKNKKQPPKKTKKKTKK